MLAFFVSALQFFFTGRWTRIADPFPFFASVLAFFMFAL